MTRRMFVLAVLLSVVPFVAVRAGDKPSAGNAGFEKIKALVGQWKGKTQEGMDISVSYRLVSAGHTVEEHLSLGDMITMYHVDGENVMLTHYCAGNNQPRMRAAPLKEGDNTLHFAFVDATNLPDPNVAHMHNAKFTFVDADHIVVEWTHYDQGKAAGNVIMDLGRVK